MALLYIQLGSWKGDIQVARRGLEAAGRGGVAESGWKPNANRGVLTVSEGPGEATDDVQGGEACWALDPSSLHAPVRPLGPETEMSPL